MSMYYSAGEGVDIDRDRLTGLHIGQLRLLVIRDDIDGLQRCDRHQLRAGLDVFPDSQSANADRAIHRGRDRRVAEVELGLVLHRLLLGKCRVGLSELALKNADLLLGRGYNRGVVPQCGLFFANIGLRLLRSLHGAEAGCGQMRVPLEILLRKDKRGLIRNDLLAVLLDNEFLLDYLLVESADARLRRRDIGTRLVERGLVIAWVDAREHRPSLDRLVVVDGSRGDVA